MFLFVQEEILRGPEGAVGTDESDSNHESGNKKRSNGSEEDNEDAEDDEEAEGLAIRECTAKYDERLIGGAEEVEEDPGAEESEEKEKGKRMGKKGKGKNETDRRQVIDSEIRVVLADAKEGIRE